MDARRNEITPGELASEAGGLMTGLGILSVMAVPFAIPALLLTLPFVLPLIVLALPLLAVWLLVRGVARLLRRARAATRIRSRTGRSESTSSARSARPSLPAPR